jgi:hypothetical protein
MSGCQSETGDMTELTSRRVSNPLKAAWGDGPWQTEPDRLEWRHAGLPCLATRGPGGHWCGYVAVPPGHPCHGKPYDDVDVDVHGGLTYAKRCEGHICHVPKPGEPDEVWWLGFDTCHAGDYAPAFSARLRQIGLWFDEAPYDHARAVAEASLPDGFLVDVYRTLDDVRAETNRLADQLAALATERR